VIRARDITEYLRALFGVRTTKVKANLYHKRESFGTFFFKTRLLLSGKNRW
jgi:hypothetical protein